ncbi:MAG: pyruvate kinase [Candidatus Heimdallarchaeum endolithica]|uniref:Pyruvate kinase n=1 Tax=Candidatus Heimdallarchaeum endolithica TaxID=2876572 RepID=A0A9Y1BQL1_9ARCH|nr:MAG: pyruvate kinase [Candidatus Heimdallarchaeum endolithica]
MTKIVCTIGPSSDSVEMLKKMEKTGMNIARLNFSHGTHQEHETVFNRIRENCPNIAIAIDIAGPKIRIGKFKESVSLEIGEKVTITNDESIISTKNYFSVNYKDLYKEVKIGSPIFINDGLVKLEVLEIDGNLIKCVVRDGGIISTRKGVNVPDSNLTLHVPTKKDIIDIEKACELEADYLFISFVRDVEDIKKIKEIIKSSTSQYIPIIAKIEHIDAVKNIKSIMENCDGLMVARGDLGIEIGPEKVPVLQKQYIQMGMQLGKPVIVATQMLESMTIEPIPTRAEASDVAHAVFDGADAVMLSAETATGIHPVNVIRVMDQIIREAEKSELIFIPKCKAKNIEESIGKAAVDIAQNLSAKAIIALTRTGYSSQMVSKYRLRLPIFASTPEKRTLRRVQLYWGVKPIFHTYETDYDQLVYTCISSLINEGHLKDDDIVVLVGGSYLGIPRKTNTIQVFNTNEVLAGKH